MSAKIFIGNQAAELETSPAFEPYSKVVLWYDDENAFTAGDDTGRTLEADCPWATQAMADALLESIKGYVYKPYFGQDALLDPAAELGDGVTIGGVYGPLASITTVFDALCASDIEAPEDEEVNHEYPYLSPSQRALDRKLTLGVSYYGTKITRANGLEITKTESDGTESAKVVLNSDQLAFYDATGAQALYFDPVAGRYKFNGILDVSGNFLVDQDGNVTINGNINLSGGTITWGGNKPASGISSSQARTLINETLVSSPNIAGGLFFNLPTDEAAEEGATVGDTWLKIGQEGGPGVGYGLVLQSYGFVENPIFGVYNGDGNATSFSAKGLTFLTVDSSDSTVTPRGEWDFSKATVTGLDLTGTDVMLEADDDVMIIAGDDVTINAGSVAVRFDAGNDRISFYLGESGTTWFLDSEGLHR